MLGCLSLDVHHNVGSSKVLMSRSLVRCSSCKNIQSLLLCEVFKSELIDALEKCSSEGKMSRQHGVRRHCSASGVFVCLFDTLLKGSKNRI